MLGKKYSLGSIVEETGEARIKLANFEELKTQSDDVASFLNTFSPDSGFVYLHVIAMGAGEYYGCNINGDYFPERDLIARHDTFVTTAKVFKEHDNKPYSPDYGHVVFSWYNPKMHRVELILAIDKIKGKEFIDRQARGEQLEVSMGCKVAYDVCSICGNKAKKASDYCNHIRQDKKKIYPDGKQPYMINYNPTFFDISIVRRRADRIAYVLSKVASADASIGNYMADEFENLDKSYIPYAPEPEEAVFDWVEPEVEKAASIASPRSATLQEKIAMIKRINSGAVKVMNEGVQKLLPALEAQEKDLPVELLDHIARKYSLPDIMRSFALRAIPMKPREFTRIIIVQTGIPKEKFHEVLKGVMQAKPLDRFPDGNYVGEIGSLLDPFLMDRSSFLPALMHRIEELKKQPEKTAAAIMLDPIGSYLDLDARLAFGHVRKPLPFQDIAPQVPEGHAVVQKDPYALTPVVMNAKALEEERRRPKLKDPVLGPVATGMTLGAIFAAYKNSEAIRALAADPKAMAILAAAAALIHHKARVSSPAAMQQKTASALGWGAKIGIPFVGAHFLAAHYRNLYNNGRELNTVEQYVAENPDVISVAAPIALHYGLKKHANISNLNLPDISDVLGIEKIAELSDTAADAARNVVSGIILRGKNRSVLSSVIDQTIDSHILNTLMGSE